MTRLGKLLGRRSFLQTAAACGAAAILARTAPAEGGWSSRLLRLEPAGGRHKPPVVTALSLHPHRRLLAIAGDDHLIRIWDFDEGRFVQLLEAHSDWVRALAYSPDGDLLCSAGNDGRLIVWDVVSGTRLSEHRPGSVSITAVRFSQDVTRLASVGFGDSLRVLDVDTGTTLRELSCPCVDMRAITFSPDGELIAGGGRNGRIRIWNWQDGRVATEYTAHQQRLRDLAFSADGRYLVSCGEDRVVYVFRLDEAHGFALPRQTAKILSLAFCGPRRLATGGSDNLIRIWDLNEHTEVDRLPGHTGSIVALAYDGQVLVSAGYDTTVRLWREESFSEGDHPIR